MNVLVIGSGGREHALSWKIAQSKDIKKLYCTPGNGGISDVAECHDINATDITGLMDFARNMKIDLVVVGPENPLAEGIVDAFQKKGIPIFGPVAQGAAIEASKIFSKELMRESSVPTAPFRVFDDYERAREYIEARQAPFVIKANGLCAGKGAYVIKDLAEAGPVLKELMVNRIYGDAGRKVVIEEFLPGIEASYLAFADGNTIVPMPASQDHKPLLDNDLGPNTGGMGAYTPIPFIDDDLDREIRETIMLRTIEAMRNKGIPYKGVLYGGLMFSGGRPYVIEFNARFGDPETQPIIFKMKSDLLPVLVACVEGKLNDIEEIVWKDGVSICVVLASGGYPEKPEKGKAIRGLDKLAGRDDVMVFHAGTKKVNDRYITSGGRVLGVTAIGPTYDDAIKKVYEAVTVIEFDGMFYRKDIGRKALMTR
ncbi:MAG: phosphoribosylamine--glycine ligase [Syntrophorhabdaceae bacterium]|nr:phosphoribosylamine--glycine ligase [Syntrophorhabdaceae bacterium]MDD4195875.1 phosphoribosylamine--glycine ligase [Syntrophorhabdaceae bacterium]